MSIRHCSPLTTCALERSLFGFGNWVTTLGGLIVFMWDTQEIVHRYMCVSNICLTVKMARRCCKAYTCVDEGTHCTWDMTLSHVIKVEKIKTWLGLMDWLQAWRASRKLRNKGPRVTVKLEQDLTPMDRRNDEEQVKSRLMNQYDHVMIWSGSYHCWSCWCMCCIDIGGVEMKCTRQRYNLGNFIPPVKGCVEKCMTGFRIDDRTIKRGKLVCISVI
jgi:hypothetical protein